MKHITTIMLAALLTAACSSKDYEYDASGMFEATEIVVSAKAQGEILSLAADEGQEVKRGEVLGTIDAQQLTLRKEQLAYTRQQAESASRQAQHTQSATSSRRVSITTQLASLQQQRDNLKREHERFGQLLKSGAASQKQVDDLDYQLKTIDRQIEATREQLATSNESISEQSHAAGSQGEAAKSQSKAIGSQIAQVEAQIGDATITAPRSGTILQRYAEAGEYAVPGKPLFKIADLQEMTLRAYITAEQYAELKLGQKVKVFVDGETPDGQPRSYEGTLTWIAQKAEFTPKTIQTKDERANLVYAIKIKVKNDGRIKIGMYGDVEFKTRQEP